MPDELGESIHPKEMSDRASGQILQRNSRELLAVFGVRSLVRSVTPDLAIRSRNSVPLRK